MADQREIAFNRPLVTGREFALIEEAIAAGQLSSGGRFSKLCERWLEDRLYCHRALLTTSGSAALELAMLLCGIGPGDEVILPSFTFVSTANAVVLRGATPVFVDVSRDTLNIDPAAVAAAVTDRTRVILCVHYAGVGCDLEALERIATTHSLRLVEDAAHALPGCLDGRPLGSVGDLAAFSFHETKNVTCGEGGALTINDPDLVDRAEILLEKGTDRRAFEAGRVEKYRWQDVGSSFALSELNAAFLWAQLQEIERVTADRQRIWSSYHQGLEELAEVGYLRRPAIPSGAEHNAHLYYLFLEHGIDRREFLADLERRGVNAVFHYVPLHSSPAGRRFGRVPAPMPATDEAGRTLIRLPLWSGLADGDVDHVIEAVASVTRAQVRASQ